MSKDTLGTICAARIIAFKQAATAIGKQVMKSDIARIIDQTAAELKKQPQTDEQWLAGLAASPAYQGIDVAREFAKCQAWCETNRKQCSRRRFVNWLNRAERPIRPVKSPQIEQERDYTRF